jgi:hypothetical protein
MKTVFSELLASIISPAREHAQVDYVYGTRAYFSIGYPTSWDIRIVRSFRNRITIGNHCSQVEYTD